MAVETFQHFCAVNVLNPDLAISKRLYARFLVSIATVKSRSMSSPCGVWLRFCGRGFVLVGLIDIYSGNRERAS